VLRALRAKTDSSVTEGDEKRNWAVVGLGAGALACYSVPGDSLTFYEIDPEMEQLALDTRYFTYLSQCAPRAQIVLGDARLKLQNAADGTYDLILIDAFSGDSIPMHLLTREALALYLRKLKPGGILAFHMSNHYLRLLPVFAGLAQDAGLVCLLDDDTVITQAQLDAGKTPSQWVVMGRSRADLGQVGTDPRWKPIAVDPGVRVWTDDYSNLLRIIRWD
jgi:SAM-dependent methyltransferase